MLRLTTALWAVLILAAAFLLYLAKYEVDQIRAEVRQTAQKLGEEREALHILEAEWAYLNRPERLDYLSRKYLALSALHGEQIIAMEEVERIPLTGEELADWQGQGRELGEALLRQSALKKQFLAAEGEE